LSFRAQRSEIEKPAVRSENAGFLRVAQDDRFYMGWFLVMDRPHDPTGGDGSECEPAEAIDPKPDHRPRLRALRDSEDNGREERE
jgi:hypothetical protein